MAKPERLARLRARMEELGLDAFLVTAPAEDTAKTLGANRRYLSGFTGSVGYLLVTRDAATIAVDFRYYEQAEREAPDFTLFRAVGALEAWFADLLRESALDGGRLGFEPSDLSLATYRTLRKVVLTLPAGQRPHLVATPPIVEQLRAVKEPEEVAAIERAVALGDEAFAAVAPRIEPGWSEKQVAWEIEKYIREHGGDGLSFETIVAAGPWAAMPHAQPRDHAIQEGEMVVIDMGVKRDGYCSDLTRTVFVGRPDDRFRAVYDIVLAAQLTAEELIEAGMTGEQAHLLAHNVITEAGYGEQFGHGLGHGVGLQVHEAPRLAKTASDKLEDGNVVTVEPGIYIPGWGGVRIEDMGVLEQSRLRVLSHAPKLAVAAL